MAVHAQDWAQKCSRREVAISGRLPEDPRRCSPFERTNLCLEGVHIASLRSTCGCTTPRIEKQTLKTYGKGAIIAHINSDRFLGHQTATLTVTLDKTPPCAFR